MLEAYQLSDDLRKVLEKQLQLLSEHGADPNGERTLVMLELVKMLSADEMRCESIVRIESSKIGELECELKMARDRISELEDTEHLMKKYKLIGGFALLFLFLLFVGLFVCLI